MLTRPDAKPREVFIAACLIAPIIAIGLYPKLATTTYDIKTVEVASKVRSALPIYAEKDLSKVTLQAHLPLSGGLAMPALVAPHIPGQ
jgi:NAD(P)H-quinone oxidoreductase subunit 4